MSLYLYAQLYSPAKQLAQQVRSAYEPPRELWRVSIRAHICDGGYHTCWVWILEFDIRDDSAVLKGNYGFHDTGDRRGSLAMT